MRPGRSRDWTHRGEVVSWMDIGRAFRVRKPVLESWSPTNLSHEFEHNLRRISITQEPIEHISDSDFSSPCDLVQSSRSVPGCLVSRVHITSSSMHR